MLVICTEKNIYKIIVGKNEEKCHYQDLHLVWMER
jgi:hypothetical protein